MSWQADLKGLTIKETKDYFKFISIKNKEALQRNEEIKATRAGIIDTIVSSAEASHPTYAETKNMREAREIEKQEHNRQNSITERLDAEENKTNNVSKAPQNGLIVEHDTQKQSENPPVLSDDEYYTKVSHFYEYDDTEE